MAHIQPKKKMVFESIRSNWLLLTEMCELFYYSAIKTTAMRRASTHFEAKNFRRWQTIWNTLVAVGISKNFEWNFSDLGQIWNNFQQNTKTITGKGNVLATTIVFSVYFEEMPSFKFTWQSKLMNHCKRFRLSLSKFEISIFASAIL